MVNVHLRVRMEKMEEMLSRGLRREDVRRAWHSVMHVMRIVVPSQSQSNTSFTTLIFQLPPHSASRRQNENKNCITKTYSRRDSRMVTHYTTNRPIRSLNIGEEQKA